MTRPQLIRDEVDRIGQTAYTIGDMRPGSDLPHLRADLDKTMAPNPCWAVGIITVREEALDRIAAEQLTIALNVLRTFALYVGIDPDRSRLGFPRVAEARKNLRLRPGERVVFGWHAMDTRLPFELFVDLLDRLLGFDRFQRVQAIVANPSPADVEQKILLGMMQFGETSQLGSLEAKLQGYLTVMEAILAREPEWKNRGKKAGRRLSLLVEETKRASLRSMLDDLYALRTRPVHYGHRTLGGYEVVTQAAIDRARLLAYFAVLLGLERAAGFGAHNDFIDALDIATGVQPGSKE